MHACRFKPAIGDFLVTIDRVEWNIGDTLGICLRYGLELVTRHRFVDEAKLLGFGASHIVASEQPFLGFAHAEMDRPEGKDMELTHRASLRLSEQRIVSRKSNIAYADQIKSACDTVTMDYGNRRLTQMEEPHPAFARQMETVSRPDWRAAMWAALLFILCALCIPEI